MGKVTNNVLPTWYNLWYKYVLLLLLKVLLSCGDLFPSHSTHSILWQQQQDDKYSVKQVKKKLCSLGRLRTERQDLKVKSKIHLYILDYKHPFTFSVIYTGLIFCRYFLYKWQKVGFFFLYTMFYINQCKINSVAVHASQTHQTTLRKSGQNAQQPGHITSFANESNPLSL